MGDKHTKKDKKTDVKIRWVLQLLTASKLAECLLRIHYSSYTEKYFGKDSEKKKNSTGAIFTQQKQQSVLFPVSLFIDNEAAF